MKVGARGMLGAALLGLVCFVGVPAMLQMSNAAAAAPASIGPALGDESPTPTTSPTSTTGSGPCLPPIICPTTPTPSPTRTATPTAHPSVAPSRKPSPSPTAVTLAPTPQSQTQEQGPAPAGQDGSDPSDLPSFSIGDAPQISGVPTTASSVPVATKTKESDPISSLLLTTIGLGALLGVGGGLGLYLTRGHRGHHV